MPPAPPAVKFSKPYNRLLTMKQLCAQLRTRLFTTCLYPVRAAMDKIDDPGRRHWIKVKLGFAHPDGKPVRCLCCGSTNLSKRDILLHEWIVCEYTVCCDTCNAVAGAWAYGSYVIG